MSRNALEHRYHRLLRAYPADYRQARGPEIVGTYLDLAGPDRAWPSLVDAADLLRGGLRQRLRAADATDLIPGVRLAAMLAFGCATTVAGVWATAAEPHDLPAEWGIPTFGPFATLGVVAWAGWLLSALVAAITPGRPTRLAIGLALALALTLALVPAAALADVPRPPLFVLLPQVVLGLLALTLPNRPPAPARFGPLLLMAVIVPVALIVYPVGQQHYFMGYRYEPPALLPAAAGLLLTVAALLGIGLRGRNGGGGWAVLVLLTPVGLLSVHPLAGAVSGLRGASNPEYPALVGTTVAMVLLGPALLPLAVAARRRFRAARPPASACPTCGR